MARTGRKILYRNIFMSAFLRFNRSLGKRVLDAANAALSCAFLRGLQGRRDLQAVGGHRRTIKEFTRHGVRV